MTRDDSVIGAALAPVRAALLDRAERDAERLLAQSDSAARRATEEASALAARMRDEARAEGAADAAAALAAERARMGRRARGIVLRAHRDDFEALRSAVRRALPDVREDTDHRRVVQKMIDMTKGILGPDAQLREGEGGGVIGEALGRRVDCSLARFADRAVEAVAAEYSRARPDSATSEPSKGQAS